MRVLAKVASVEYIAILLIRNANIILTSFTRSDTQIKMYRYPRC